MGSAGVFSAAPARLPLVAERDPWDVAVFNRVFGVPEGAAEEMRAVCLAYRGARRRRGSHHRAFDDAVALLRAQRPELTSQSASAMAQGYLSLAARLAGPWLRGEEAAPTASLPPQG